ncbi:MAG: 3-dehydroquinate synthase, partial [Elusimicrobiota bacterium]
VLALGGGVVGDMAGFVASSYRRGVPFVQMPTTLLSAVDSSIGGKTGIDFRRKGKIIKNIVGSFYQPSLVLTDISFLKTLPKKELLNGLAEIIKYGVIKEAELFHFIDKNIAQILDYGPEALGYIIGKSTKIKRDIVQLDEKETKNIRIILNYGHTVGHAIEGAGNFKTSHGEAVAIGMVCEAEISFKLGLLAESKCLQIERLIAKAGLPVKIKGCTVSSLMEIMKYDKKFRKGQNKFVLPVDIGKVTVKTGIPNQIIRSVLEKRLIK